MLFEAPHGLDGGRRPNTGSADVAFNIQKASSTTSVTRAAIGLALTLGYESY